MDECRNWCINDYIVLLSILLVNWLVNSFIDYSQITIYNRISYLKEVDIDTLEVTGEIKDFVAIVNDKYHKIASEFP